MKRLVVVCLVVVGLVGSLAFVGCGGKEEAKPDTTVTAPQGSDVKPPAELEDAAAKAAEDAAKAAEQAAESVEQAAEEVEKAAESAGE